MKTIFSLGVLAATGCAATIASAQTAEASGSKSNTGFYIGVHAGSASPNNPRIDYSEAGGSFGGTGATDKLSTKADLKNAVDFGGALGYDFGAIRADVEVDYTRNKVRGLLIKSLNGTAVTSISAAAATSFCAYEEITGCSVSGNRLSFDGGKVRQLSGLVNLWYDIPVGRVLTPYVGVGVGVGGFEFEGEGKARLAYQVGAGVAFNLSRGIAITADYRHRWINGATFTDSEDASFALSVSKIQTNIFSGGLRFTF